MKIRRASGKALTGRIGLALTALAIGLITAWSGTASADDDGETVSRSHYNFRPYFQTRIGQAFFTSPNSVGGLELESPAGQPVFGFSAGADIGRHFGVELSGDYVKTDLLLDGGGKAGDYSVASLSLLGRFRYPLMDDRLVPYALAGAGVGLGEFSGRENFAAPVGGDDYAPFGVIGAGVEYFVDHNIALGIEAKQTLGFRPQIRFGAGEQTADADQLAITGTMRVYFDRLAGALDAPDSNEPPPADSDELRGYLALRGGTAIFTDTDAGAVTLDRTSGVLGAASLGINFDENWGAEIAAEYSRAQLNIPGIGKVVGYPVYTFLGLGRYRYPILNGRLSPYVVAGAGIGVRELGDRDVPASVSGLSGERDSTFVGAFGAGFDYFLEDNVSVGIEARRTFLFENDVTVNGRSVEIDASYVSLSAGLKIYFP